MTFEPRKEQPWLNPKKVEFKQEVEAEPLTKEEVEDEVLEAVKEVKEEEVKEAKPKEKWTANEKRALVRQLRKQDDAHNHTCASSLKRLPLDQFSKGKQSEVCKDCED